MLRACHYDAKLTEHWSDRHIRMAEDCEGLDPIQLQAQGLELLRQTHDLAPNQVEPIAPSWQGHYYVRGTYQVLAIDLQVGWHTDYRKLLKDQSMALGHGIFAETNPAYCAALLATFVGGYDLVVKRVPTQLCAAQNCPWRCLDTLRATSIAMTVALDYQIGSIVPVHPDTPRYTSPMGIVTEAIRFGCFSQLPSMMTGGHLWIARRQLLGTADDLIDFCRIAALKIGSGEVGRKCRTTSDHPQGYRTGQL